MVAPKRQRGTGSDAQSTRTKRNAKSHLSTVMMDAKGGGAGTKRESKNVPESYSNETKTVMKQFTYQVIKEGCHTLRVKYNELRSFVPPDPAKTAFDANPTKNRYKDVPCWDKTRVSLTWPPGVPGEYIHANRISHEYLDQQQFICCQGPLDATVPDFWRLVWQEKVKQIIMLCRTQELGKEKCAQYWPNVIGNSMSFHGLNIKCEKIDETDRSFIHSKLVLKCGDEVRKIDHRLFFAWPDKSVPKTPMAPFRLLQFSRKNPKFPTIIHCSAGIGRTGTMVLIELMYKSLLRNKIPDVPQLVKELRAQRASAVQTENQYLYCHYSVLQLLHIKQTVPSHFIKHFVTEYEAYLKLLDENGGIVMPLNLTTMPEACTKCPKIFTQSLEQKPDSQNANSPPSNKEKDKEPEKKKDKESIRESVRERKNKDKDKEKDKEKDMGSTKEKKKDMGSQREKKKDVGSAREKKKKKDKDNKEGGEDKDSDREKKNNIFKRLKAQKDKGKNKKRTAESEAAKDGTVENLQSCIGGATQMNMLDNPEEDKKDKDDDKKDKDKEEKKSEHDKDKASKSTEKLGSKEGVQSPPAHVASTPPQPGSPCGQTANFAYKPASTYTIQQAGGKEAIVYHRPNQPFVKALASPAGMPIPQILINTNGQNPPNNQQTSTPPP